MSTLPHLRSTRTRRPRKRAVPIDVTHQRLLDSLTVLYGSAETTQTLPRLMSLLAGRQRPPQHSELNETDAVLIAYGDHVRDHNGPGLRALENLLRNQLGGVVNGIHLLPFHSSTSDGGFAVSDFDAVDASLGTWQDVDRLSTDHRLMVDCVLNHVSAQHPWFKGFLAGDARYADHFIAVGDDWPSDRIARPTTSPLFHTFESNDGPVRVWTTFGPDQPDLNYANPAVLVDVVRSLLSYVEHGAAVLRLSAVAYLWKDPTTACFDHPATHAVVGVLRNVIDAVDPSILLTADVDAPDAVGDSYFGGGQEAELVTQSALAPLLLHTLHSGNATRLTAWAAGRGVPSPDCTFYNVTATHDGIGLPAVRGILAEDEIRALVRKAVEHGGAVSYQATPEGPQPYELNLTYFDAITAPTASVDEAIDRFMVTQAIMLSLLGLPGIYLPSLFGTSTGRGGAVPRDRNRMRFDAGALERELRDPWSKAARVFSRYTELLRVRTSEPAFHPHGTQQVRMLGPGIFAVERRSPDNSRHVLALHNVTDMTLTAPVLWVNDEVDLITGARVSGELELAPYQAAWIGPRH